MRLLLLFAQLRAVAVMALFGALAAATARAGDGSAPWQSPVQVTMGLHSAAERIPPTAAETVPAFPLSASGTATLSLQQLEAIALANNPAIAEAANRVAAARGSALQAGLPPNPQIGYLGTEIGNEGLAGQQGALIGQRLITGGKRRLARSAAAAGAFQLEQQLAAYRYRVLTDVRNAYYQALVARRRITLARRLVEIGDLAAAAADDLFRAQEVGGYDVHQANIEAKTARVGVRRAENGGRAAWRRLAAILGVPDMASAPLDDTLDQRVAIISWEDALARLLSESPEVAAAVARVEKAEWTIERERAQPIPDLNLQAAAQYDHATQDTYASVQVLVPIPLHDRNQGNIRRAEAEMAAARAALVRVELELERRLADVYRAYADARYAARTYADDILPDAEKSLELVAAAYRQGESGYLTLLTAQRTYFRTHLEYLDSLANLHKAVVEIEGYLLTGSLAERP